MKFLVPIALAVAGVGAGVGAGVALRPATVANGDAQELQAQGSDERAARDGAPAVNASRAKEDGEGTSAEYVQMKSQFIVPVLHDSRVTSLVVLSIDLEVGPEQAEAVHRYEPKIRDAFLTVLFDHANTGGFEGNFTSSGAMGMLRGALREAGQKAVGDRVLTDVLITNIIRQDV